MTPGERYDAVVEATRLLRAVFNDLPGRDEALRRDLYVAAQTTERIAGKLYAPAFYPWESPHGETCPWCAAGEPHSIQKGPAFDVHYRTNEAPVMVPHTERP